mgnify:CR=1 FL=1
MNISAQDVINAIFNPDDTVCLRIFDDRKEGIFTGAKMSVEAGKAFLCNGAAGHRFCSAAEKMLDLILRFFKRILRIRLGVLMYDRCTTFKHT